jgi:hypothetical protein
MHKIKKAIADLRVYLGRDTAAIERLSEVETIANNMRKQLASEKGRAGLAIKQANSDDAALVDAKGKIRQLESELHRERHVRLQRERDVETLKREAEKLSKPIDQNVSLPDEIISNDNLYYVKSLLSSIRMLKHRWRVCPKAETSIAIKKPKVGHQIHEQGFISVYGLDTVIGDLSGAELMNLGRLVTVLAAMNVPAVFKYQGTIQDQKAHDRDQLAKFFIPWFRENVNLKAVAKFGDQEVDLGNRFIHAYDGYEQKHGKLYGGQKYL